MKTGNVGPSSHQHSTPQAPSPRLKKLAEGATSVAQEALHMLNLISKKKNTAQFVSVTFPHESPISTRIEDQVSSQLK